MASSFGKLFLVPVPLGEHSSWTLSADYLAILHQISFFIVENAKTARRFLKQFQMPIPLADLEMVELNEHTPPEDLPAFLQVAIEQGRNIALLSEAGCPCVADPGAAIVALAHQQGIEVMPWVGPSSILLALMASGFSGQQFAFRGYLPVEPARRKKELQQLEKSCRQWQQTQIFIETPYRNDALFRDVLATLATDTLLCLAVDLTLPTQYIQTLSIAKWKKKEPPMLHKRPTIFLIGI